MSKPTKEEMVKDIDLRSVDKSTLGEEHINPVAESLHNVAHHYKGIGRVLRLPFSRVEQIYREHKTDFFGGTTAIVAEYITQAGKYKYGAPTMWKIIAAVSNSGGGNNHLQAKKIATEYPPGSLEAITNPEQETFSCFEDVSTLQGCHGPHPSASLPILSQHQYQQTGQVPKRHLSDPSGKQSAEFYIGGDTMPAIHEQQTGNTNQGNFTTSSDQGVISSQQRGQPYGVAPNNQQSRYTQSMVAPGGSTNYHTQGMQPTSAQAQNQPSVVAPGGSTNYHTQGMQPTSAQAQNQPSMVAPGGATNYHSQGMQPTSAQAQNQPFGQQTRPQENREFIEHREVSLTQNEMRKRTVGINKPLSSTNPEDIPDSPTSTRGKIYPASRVRGRGRGRSKNSQQQCPKGSPPSFGRGFRTASHEQSHASTAVGYCFDRNPTTYTSSATSLPSVPVSTTPIGSMTAKFGQIRVNQADIVARQPAVYTAPPPPQEQSQTRSESLTSFMSGDSITESSLNSSTYSEACLDDELPPTMYSPKTKSKMPKELFKEDVYESGYSKRDFQPSKYSQHGMSVPEYQEPQSPTPPEATLGDSRPINPQPPLNKSPHIQPKDYSDVPFPRSQEYSTKSPHLQPKVYSGVYVPLPRSQESAGAPPPIPQVANLPMTQASVTSDPTQSQFSAAQSYQTGRGFFEGQQPTMDSLQSDELIETLSSNNTETLRTLQNEREETDRDTALELGNSVVASVQSRSGVESYVKGIDPGAVAKIENSSLVSGIAKQNPNKPPNEATNSRPELSNPNQGHFPAPRHNDQQPQLHVRRGPHGIAKQNKPPKETTNSRAELSNPNQGHFPTPGLYDQQPQLHVRRGPHSIASSKSSQSVDRPYGAKGGAPPATMELVSMEDKVVLKPNNYSAPQINPDVEREDEPQQQEYVKEPISMASTSSFESASFSGLHGPSSVTPSDVGGKTEHGQCSSMPHSLEASPSPRQQAKIGSQLKDEMRPSNSSVAGPNKEPMASTSSFLTPSYVGGKTEHAQCSSIPHSLEISASPQQQAKIGSQQQDEVRPSNWSMAGPNEVFGSSHIQQEIPPESEPILDYQTLLSGSHDGYRPCEDGGNIPFKSYEALQIRGEERYKKIKLEFALLSPRRGQRIISDEDDYPMKRHPHGLALIINNENFKDHDRREGTNVDETNLTMTLRYLGYNVEIHRDVATKDMIQLFEEVKLRDHSAYDSFICCILTHGESGRVFGVDSYPVLIETLTGKLCAASCPSLKGKPKIFFIQACRGKLKCFKVAADHGGTSDFEKNGDPDEDDHEAHASQDSPGFNLKRAIVRSLSMEAAEDEEERVKADGFDLPDVTDFFFGFATPSGQVAWRDLDHGSWYISELCRQLCTYSVSKSLSDIMTKVHDSVGTGDVYRYGKYKQAPETTSRLRRKVFF